MSKIRATFTFVRHGESTDNVRHIWAGWADATLSNHGMNQAQAVGASLSRTQFTAIHSSPLKRAYMTAEVIQNQQLGSSPLTTSPLLREQHFGVAEGKSLARKRDPDIPLAQQFEAGIYPASLTPSRDERFPEGESLNDVQARARQVWADILLPYVETAHKEENHVHVAVVSHGIFIKEALRALAMYDCNSDITACNYQWLRNTAWARVDVGVKDNEGGDLKFSIGVLSPLQIKLTHFSECGHLTDVKRQKGGTGREAYDPRQKDIRGFFGGKANRKSRGI
ncbi:histidine phosphatase superfamily [Mycena latifolia]|nr:histidine phosphatase superfamily [Mycena latifolia]